MGADVNGPVQHPEATPKSPGARLSSALGRCIVHALLRDRWRPHASDQLWAHVPGDPRSLH